jgi:hypothetical protein
VLLNGCLLWKQAAALHDTTNSSAYAPSPTTAAGALYTFVLQVYCSRPCHALTAVVCMSTACVTSDRSTYWLASDTEVQNRFRAWMQPKDTSGSSHVYVDATSELLPATETAVPTGVSMLLCMMSLVSLRDTLLCGLAKHLFPAFVHICIPVTTANRISYLKQRQESCLPAAHTLPPVIPASTVSVRGTHP